MTEPGVNAAVCADQRDITIAATPAAVYAALIDPERVARWWGPAGFTNTIHTFDCVVGGAWHLTMHSSQGQDFPNESRFSRLEPHRIWEIEHLNGHHFFLTLTLHATPDGTRVEWTQTFDTAEHFAQLRSFVAQANAENLVRLHAEVLRQPQI